MAQGKLDREFGIQEGWIRDTDDEIGLDGYNAFISITTNDNTSGFQVFNDVGGVTFYSKSGGDGYVAGKLGVGKLHPTAELDVVGSAKFQGFQLPPGAVDGYVLTSNNLGVGTWRRPTGGGISDGFTIFAIWAEENGGLSDNNRQWSFGNGSTGSVNIVIPFECELFAGSLDAESAGTSVSIDFLKNDSAVVETPLFVGGKDFKTFQNPTVINAGDYIGFRTNTETGVYTDARVSAWFRVRTTPASTSILNDLIDVNISNIQNGDILRYDGASFVSSSFSLDGYIDGIGVKNDGTTVVSSSNVLNFIGPGVTVTSEGGNQSNITIPGGGSSVEVRDDGATVTAAATALDFGLGLDSTDNGGGVVTVDITPGILDGYALQTDLQGLDNTVSEHYNQHSDAIQQIISELDGYINIDEKIKVSSNDTTPGYLSEKLIAGSGITLLEQNDGGNENVLISATSGNNVNLDGYVDEEKHRELDQLVHQLDEDYYEEVSYNGIFPTVVIYWTDINKVIKIREHQYSYNAQRRLSQQIIIQYDEAGTEVERLTLTYTYLPFGRLNTVTSVRTS
jgi:hypothetical protein